MIQSKIKIVNHLGLHARAAAKFAECASLFSSDIEIGTKHQMVNGKSIMSVMMLAASKGTTLTLKVRGNDENKANEALTKLVEEHFGEDS